MCMNDLSPYMWLNLKQFYQLTVTLVLWDSSTSCSLQIRNLKALKARLVKQQTILQPELFNSFMKWGAIAGWFVVLKPASREPLICSRVHEGPFGSEACRSWRLEKLKGKGKINEGRGMALYHSLNYYICYAQPSSARAALPEWLLCLSFLNGHFSALYKQWVRSCYFLPHFTMGEVRHKTISKLIFKGIEHTCSSWS